MSVSPVRKMIVLAALLGMVAAVGCQQGTDAPSGQTATDEPAAQSPAAQEATVRVVDSSLGRILADVSGRTLYVFMNDKAGESACYDQCAQRWPPLIVTDSPQPGADVNPELLSTTERKDGATQVKYKDQPLYYFSGDETPGDTKGQGVGGVWFVVSPEGEPIRS